jgi:hypothetical protein
MVCGGRLELLFNRKKVPKNLKISLTLSDGFKDYIEDLANNRNYAIAL